MTQLSISMPSNRNLYKSRAAIESALVYAEKTDSQLIVSDNSGDPAKRAYFEHRSPRLIYIVPEGDDAAVNMMNALSRVDTPFVMPMADDDDVYLLDNIEPISLADLPEDTVAVRPRSYAWSMPQGVRKVGRFSLSANDAAGRLMEYNSKANGDNSIFYSIYRTKVFRGLAVLFQDAHPTRGGYCDWAMSYAFAAAGKFAYDPATIYRYDLGNWTGKDGLEASVARLFKQAGLPEEAEHFSALLRFVDAHVFLVWAGLPISDHERLSAQVTNARIALGTFIRKVEGEPDLYGEEVRYLTQMLQETPDIASAFQLAILILDRLLPGLSARYIDFYNTATAKTA
ncbi:hypothetical protein [Pararhizobium sp. O133]|uniref:hypothetical protein n=1 Tax=Pararhizobium sp. O133 TaxID=3449278 RepID=UPI003F6849C1